MAKDQLEAELEAELDASEAAVTAATAGQGDPASGEPDVATTLEQPKHHIALLRSSGFEVDDDTTEEQATEWIREQASAAERAIAAEKRAAQLEAYLSAQQQKLAEPAVAPAAAAPAASATAAAAAADDDLGIPDPPKLNAVTMQMLQVAQQNGLLKESVGGFVSSDDPNVRQYVDEYNRHIAAAAAYKEEWGDPRKIATRVIEKQSKKLLTPYEERIVALERQVEDHRVSQIASSRDQFLVENSHFFAEVNAEGQPILDAQKNLIPNANYQRFWQYEASLEKSGIKDPAERLARTMEAFSFAMPPAHAAQAAAGAAPAEPPTTTPAEKRAKVRSRTTGNLNGKHIAQAPVARSRGGATEIVDSPRSIGQLKNRWNGMLEQAVGGDE